MRSGIELLGLSSSPIDRFLKKKVPSVSLLSKSSILDGIAGGCLFPRGDSFLFPHVASLTYDSTMSHNIHHSKSQMLIQTSSHGLRVRMGSRQEPTRVRLHL